MNHFASPEILESRIAPAVFIVTSNLDSASATAGDGTLRGEILAANAHHGSNEIKFASGISAITLASGPIAITNTLLIDGPSMTHVTITGDGSAGIFGVSGKGASTTFNGLTLTGGVATGNGASVDNGGAIASSASITVQNCTFTNNQAGYGGAIGISTEGLPGNITASLTVKDSQFYRNSASNSGGAIWMGGVNGSLSIAGSTLGATGEGNNGDLAGGAVYFTANAFLLSHSSVADNSVPGGTTGYGGGLYVQAGSIKILSSSITDNTVKSDGGGAALAGLGAAGKVVISGGSISGNQTEGNGSDLGGGLTLDVIQSKVPSIITGTAILANTSLGSGGGVYVRGGSVSLSGVAVGANSAAGDGGGIETLGKLTVQGGSIFGNSAAGIFGGGGIAAGAALSVTSTHITGNTASGGGAEGGGILDFEALGPLTVSSALINSNSAHAGGGLAIYGGVPAKVTGSTISANQSSYNGGGLYAQTTGALTLSGDTFAFNNLLTSSTHYSAAGAFIVGKSSIKISSVSFTGNSGLVPAVTNESTGGLYVNGESASTAITITGSHFTGNSGYFSGGLLVGTTGTAKVTGITAMDNIGDVFGGGFTASNNCTLLASTITGNINPENPTKSNTYGHFNT